MLLPSIRRLALADVTSEVLAQLVEHGESLYVERKRELPAPPGFGRAAASFANMLGGFVLLGVEDDGRVVGWTPPERTDLQSHLGELLRAQVDALPPYVAEMRELDGKKVGVVRVFESADTPHIVRGTAAIVVRSSKGNEPVAVDDHQTVLAMARRGDVAENDARDRLNATPAVAHVLLPPDPPQTAREFAGVEVIARAAPLTVTPALRDWPLTRRAAERCLEIAAELRPPATVDGFQYHRDGPHLEPFGRAVAARVMQERGGGATDEAVVVADSAGVVGAALRRGAARGDSGVLLLNAMLEDELLPLARALAGLLVDSEAYGRAVADVLVRLGPSGRLAGQMREPLRPTLHVSRELVVAADENEVGALAEQWHRELQREMGIPKFEGEPGE